MIRIELPFSFYFINWLDPEPNGSETVQLQQDIVDHLKLRNIEYSLVVADKCRYIGFKDPSDAVYFKIKMGEWEEQFKHLNIFAYKGHTQFDAAAYYAPYMPLPRTSVKNPFETKGLDKFQTRYGTIYNNNKYWRLNDEDDE